MTQHVYLDIQAATQKTCSVRLPEVQLGPFKFGGQCPGEAVNSLRVEFPVPGLQAQTLVNLCEPCLRKVLGLYKQWIDSRQGGGA